MLANPIYDFVQWGVPRFHRAGVMPRPSAPPVNWLAEPRAQDPIAEPGRAGAGPGDDPEPEPGDTRVS